ncbi:MAG TPA: hypothetical protein VHH72_01020 [Solirubrobacterales bacterium]|jgi:hypothetical protein|nr:hypothetical protein [Solirubrobacterales bacterium]
MALGMALAMPACGGGDDQPASTTEAAAPPAAGEAPAEPAPTGTSPDVGDPGFGEASPEADPEGGTEGTALPAGDEAAATQAVRDYVAALDAHDGAATCAVLAPGALPVSELPVRRGGCAASLDGSIGHRRKGGLPAWKRTDIVEVTAVSLGENEARVTATVTHRFADRKYTSVEEDVVYLERVGGRWLIAKPSATLYRAVGYPEPPLRAFTPPS